MTCWFFACHGSPAIFVAGISPCLPRVIDASDEHDGVEQDFVEDRRDPAVDKRAGDDGDEIASNRRADTPRRRQFRRRNSIWRLCGPLIFNEVEVVVQGAKTAH